MAAKTFQEAKQYLDDPYSCFKLISTTKHITLPPCYLGKLRSGVKEELGSEMQLFSDSLNGVLIAFENVKLLKPFGDILDDQPYIHFDVNVDMIIFQPSVGSLVRGVVHKIAVDHIGCLVHGCFNAAILKPKQEVNGWKGAGMTLGEEFILRVVRIETERGVLSMKGVIEDIELPRGSNAALRETTASMETELTSVKQRVLGEKSGKSRKGSKKSSEKRDTSEEGSNVGEIDGKVTVGTEGVDGPTQRKEKRKKRKRDKLQTAETDPVTDRLVKIEQTDLDSPSSKRPKIVEGVTTGQNSGDLDGGSTSKGQNGDMGRPSSPGRKKSKKSKRKESVEIHNSEVVNVKVEPKSDELDNVKKKSKKSKKSKKK